MRIWFALAIAALIVLGAMAFLAARQPDNTLGLTAPVQGGRVLA
ncbi:hypothetical protein [Palleronia abyssalis]|uniref:Uncharacterized protein n=1 Tax=Palleronia abyssalis TaxID=1501240 RepID=A0A2R8BR47_9RHOB|nr:hypothetical protein [Palleronia abyssalis]SPJ22611.1 hypothetical protein PAA8504_00406 [Palleronia abyssalis]